MIKMDKKQKLLQLRSEIRDDMQNLENAINHIRDYQDLFETKIRNMEISMLKAELKRREEKASK